jgi:hypothetical protein
MSCQRCCPAMKPACGWSAAMRTTSSTGFASGGAAKRQGPRPEGAICPETLANNLVKLHLRDLAALFNGSLQALAQAGRFGATIAGILDATDLETTQHYANGGQVTRKRKLTDKGGGSP